ncbi:MAG: LemA family protein [Flavobacteriales bacterium]|nr:LemA family protein [Flavobacteriales bacterium]
MAFVLLLGGCGYNGMLTQSKKVDEKWAMVESAYQARADKVKGLAAIVKNAADYERQTLTDVIEARSKATSVNISADNLTPETLAQFEAAQSQFTGALGKLLAVIEQYPDLKAVQLYRDFEYSYDELENQIKFARNEYSTAATDFNIKIKRIPNVFYASILGFYEKPLFKSNPGTENAPNVNDALKQ